MPSRVELGWAGGARRRCPIASILVPGGEPLGGYAAVYPVDVQADADPCPSLVDVAGVLVESLVVSPVGVGKGWVAGLVGGVPESVPVREPDVVRGCHGPCACCA